MSIRMAVRRMPAARTMVQVRRGEKIDELREIVSARLASAGILRPADKQWHLLQSE